MTFADGTGSSTRHSRTFQWSASTTWRPSWRPPTACSSSRRRRRIITTSSKSPITQSLSQRIANEPTVGTPTFRARPERSAVRDTLKGRSRERVLFRHTLLRGSCAPAGYRKRRVPPVASGPPKVRHESDGQVAVPARTSGAKALRSVLTPVSAACESLHVPILTTLLVTGGAGFIGSNFVHLAVREGFRVVNLDKLTYAGNLENVGDLTDNTSYVFAHGDIGDRALVAHLLETHQPVAVLNFAAESHVDRSIDAPAEFVHTNVVGTFELLQASIAYWRTLSPDRAAAFRFLQVSTDEVFGSLGPTGAFTEASPYAPNSAYAASKAAADHFVRAAHVTDGLPTLTTHGTNNFGPHQFPEKLVPLTILNAMEGKPLPVYGDGENVRDWIYVEDHCEAILEVLKNGAPGSTFNVGSRCERTNIQVVKHICALLDELAPHPRLTSHADLITFVPDRPGHDRRYAIDPGLIERTLRWKPAHTFDAGLKRTVRWYLENRGWCERVSSGEHRRERIGLRSENVA